MLGLLQVSITGFSFQLLVLAFDEIPHLTNEILLSPLDQQ